MSAVDSARRPVFLAVLLLAAAALAVAQEPTVVRLRDAVGDTIDPAERDSFHLFPNTAGFERAVVLALPGPEFFAKVRRPGADSVGHIFLRIMPRDLERIRFLIDNQEYVAEQQRSDSAYARALASFWHAIEDSPLRNMAGEPAVAHAVPPAPPGVVPPGEPVTAQEVPEPPEAVTTVEPAPSDTAVGDVPQPVSIENRYNYTLHGATVGSAAGGCIGSQVAIEQVGYSYRGCVSTPIYEVNHPAFWAAACGMTALGSTVGYLQGKKLDGNTFPSRPAPPEGTGWRTGCAIGAAIPGVLLGIGAATLAGALQFRFGGSIENDPSGLTILPAALTGLCVAVEVVTIGYRYGRDIDRNKALEAEVKRRALGR